MVLRIFWSIMLVTMSHAVLAQRTATDADDLISKAKKVTISDFVKADSLYLCALEIRKEVFGANSLEYALTQADRAEVLYESQQYEGVEAMLKNSLEIIASVSGENSIEYGETLSLLGLYYTCINNMPEAEKAITRAYEIIAASVGTSDYRFGKILQKMGIMYIYKHNFTKAEEYFDAAIDIYATTCDCYNISYIEAKAMLSTVYGYMARYDEAREIAIRVMSEIETAYGRHNYIYAALLSNLGANYTTCGEYNKGESILLESLDVTRTIFGERHSNYFNILNNLSSAYIQMGRLDEAETFARKSLDIRIDMYGEANPSTINAMNNLAVFYMEIGDYAKSQELLLRTIELAEEVLGEESYFYNVAVINLVKLYYNSKELEKAMAVAEKCDQVLKRHNLENDPRFLAFYSLYPDALLKDKTTSLGTEEKILEHLSKIESVSGETSGIYTDALDKLFNYYFAAQEYEKAVDVVDKLLNIYEQLESTNTYLYMLFLDKKGVCLIELERYESAYQCLNRCLGIMKEIARQNFAFMTEQETYIYWQKINPSLNYIIGAGIMHNDKCSSFSSLIYDCTLFSKSLLLSSSLKVRNSIINSGDKELVSYWEQLREEKKDPGKSDEILRLEKHIALKSKEYNRQNTDFDINWNDVAKSLAADEVGIDIVNLYSYEDGVKTRFYCALVVRNDYACPAVILLKNEDTLAAALEQSRYDAQSLYPIVWKPLEEHLEGVKTVYISPSGLLNSVSFAGMKTPDGYLCDRYNIVNLLSTKDLVNIKSQDNVCGPKSIALFGGADFGLSAAELNKPDTVTLNSTLRGLIDEFDNTRGQGFDYLPNSKREVESIGKILSEQGWQTTVYIDRDATETHLKSLSSQSPAVLHISTHGYYFPLPNQDTPSEIVASDTQNKFELSDNPLMRSGLLLSGANSVWKGGQVTAEEDGILTAYEIADLDLSNVRLAVLSACNTGVGHVDYAEGVYGLQRALRLAEVKSMIVALWPIPDRETVELMECFYREWGQSGNLKRAFTEAQLEMRTRYPTNPEVWAAFILIE